MKEFLDNQQPRERPRRFGPLDRRLLVRAVAGLAVLAIVVYGAWRWYAGRAPAVEMPAQIFVSLATGERFQVEVAAGRIRVQGIEPGAAPSRPLDAMVLECTRDDLKRLVDALGGVLVNIPEKIEYQGEDGLTARIDAGMRRLDGDRVEIYLKRPGAPVTGTLRAVALGVTTRIAELRREGDDLQALLAAALSDRMRGDDGRNAVRLASFFDRAAAVGAADIEVRWPDARPEVEPPPVTTAPEPSAAPVALRLRLLNGNGKAGLVTRVARIFPADRFTLVDSGNADRFNYERTLVRATDETRARAAADLLGLGAVEIGQPDGVDVEVVLGRDSRRKW